MVPTTNPGPFSSSKNNTICPEVRTPSYLKVRYPSFTLRLIDARTNAPYSSICSSLFTLSGFGPSRAYPYQIPEISGCGVADPLRIADAPKILGRGPAFFTAFLIAVATGPRAGSRLPSALGEYVAPLIPNKSLGSFIELVRSYTKKDRSRPSRPMKRPSSNNTLSRGVKNSSCRLVVTSSGVSTKTAKSPVVRVIRQEYAHNRNILY